MTINHLWLAFFIVAAISILALIAHALGDQHAPR
jgi:hypothetical protein